MMYNKKTILIVVVAVIVLGGIIWLSVGGKPSSNNQPGEPGGAASPTPAAPVTRQPAPTNVVVPPVNATNVPQGVAVPQTVSQGSPSDKSVSIRTFSIKADNNQFTPDTIIVKTVDTITINMTAVDKDYDFTQPDYGLKVAVPKGTTKMIQFGATASGKFTFYCKSCGGPMSGPMGYIIVAAK